MAKTPKGEHHKSYKRLYDYFSEGKGILYRIISGEVDYDGEEGLDALDKLATRLTERLAEIRGLQEAALAERTVFTDLLEEEQRKSRELDERAKIEAAEMERKIAHDPETRRKIEESEKQYQQNRSGLEFAVRPDEKGEDNVEE